MNLASKSLNFYGHRIYQGQSFRQSFRPSSIPCYKKSSKNRRIRPCSTIRSSVTPKIQKRSFLTIINEYQAGVRLRLGSFSTVCEPGIRLRIPIMHNLQKVDLRSRVRDIPNQEIITKDGVSCHIDSTLQFKVRDPAKAILNVEHYDYNTQKRAELCLREVVSEMDSEDVLKDREKVSSAILSRLEPLLDEWGIKVEVVQINSMNFDESMKRAMAKRAEALRTAQAKVINAEADIETAKLYSKAAEIYEETPISLRLREFQLWSEVAKEKSNFLAVVPSNVLDTMSRVAK